jgi:hypothetical protein
VDAVSEIAHCRRVANLDVAASVPIGQPDVLFTDLSDTREVRRAADREHDERAPLVGASELLEGDAIARFVQSAEIRDELIMANEPISHLVSEGRGRDGDLGVVLDVARKKVGERNPMGGAMNE